MFCGVSSKIHFYFYNNLKQNKTKQNKAKKKKKKKIIEIWSLCKLYISCQRIFEKLQRTG